MHSKYNLLTLKLIKPALKGKLVSITDTPDGLKSYRDYLSMGFYLNSSDGAASHFVPRLSPLLLMIFAEHHAKSEVRSSEHECAKVLLSMLQLEPKFTWQQYEQFHVHWEVLYRILFHGEIHTLSSLYHSGAKNLCSNPSFTLLKKDINLCKLDTEFPPPHGLSGILPNKLKHQVFVPYPDNPGFDVFYIEEQPKSKSAEPIAVCVECRFSDPKATTALSLAEVHDKHQKTHKQFASYLPKGGESLCGLTLKEKNIFLVVCAYHKIPCFANNTLPSNTIVLGREQLNHLYTPSLSSRPQFITSSNVNVDADVNNSG